MHIAQRSERYSIKASGRVFDSPCASMEKELKLLPIGTRIIFIKELASGPSEYSPGNLYARKGDGGEVTGHDCWEGHWVKWDKWPAPFGAQYGIDFIEE